MIELFARVLNVFHSAGAGSADNLEEEEFVIIMSELLNVKMYIFDMDGQSISADMFFPIPLKTVRQLRQREKSATNNARCRDAYIEKIVGAGFSNRRPTRC